MYIGLLHTHTLLRYFILIALVVVIVLSLMGWLNKKPFGKWHDKASLYLLIFTHLQLLTGLVLYFVSPNVKFGPDTMSNTTYRYWTVEHIAAMLIAIVLITVARISSKRMNTDMQKHRRLFNFNVIALVIIVGTILMGGRKLL